MALSDNIKHVRRSKGISQEYMSEQLHMSQSTYSRLENNDTACLTYLPQIAQALDTTPDLLQNYQPINNPEPALTESSEGQLAEKDAVINKQKIEITFLKNYTAYLHSVWHEYCRGGQAMLNR